MKAYTPRCYDKAPVHLSRVPTRYSLGKEAIDGLRRQAGEDHASDRHGMIILCGIARIMSVGGHWTGILAVWVQFLV